MPPEQAYDPYYHNQQVSEAKSFPGSVAVCYLSYQYLGEPYTTKLSLQCKDLVNQPSQETFELNEPVSPSMPSLAELQTGRHHLIKKST